MIRKVIALSLMITYASGNSCCLSKQLEVKSESVTLLEKGHREATMNMSMDFDLGFVNLVVDVSHPAPRTTTRILQDLKHNMTYYIDMDTGDCSMSNSTLNFGRQCFNDSQKIDSMYFGKPGHSLQSNVYKISLSFYGIDMKYTLTNGCVPLYLAFVPTSSRAISNMQLIKFYNYTEGIKDKSVFDIPKKCLKVEQPTFLYKRWSNHVSIQDFK